MVETSGHAKERLKGSRTEERVGQLAEREGEGGGVSRLVGKLAARAYSVLAVCGSLLAVRQNGLPGGEEGRLAAGRPIRTTLLHALLPCPLQAFGE